MSRCYSDDSLRGLGDDELDPARFEDMERHVQSCPHCGSRVEALARVCPSLTIGSPMRVGARVSGVLELDDFVIEGEIGRGAMGVVHRARDRRLERPVALKVLSQSGADADARRRWLREARAFSTIRHPNVVSLYDCREVDAWLVLVLEYVPGGSLAKRASGPVSPRVAAGLMETISQAVAFVHDRGVLHLDLKPSNILLDGAVDGAWEGAVPLISDFGLALFHEDGEGAEPTQDGPRGTPSYMAPEQTTERRSKLGPAADIYALGVVLYELLTGRPPHRAASAHETMELVRTQDPVPLRRLNPKAPRDLETIAHKCLEKAPKDRYTSAEELAGDLRRWIDGLPIKARRPSLAGRAWRVGSRHRAATFLGLALVATVAASFGLLLQAYARAEAARQVAERNFEFGVAMTEWLEDVILRALGETLGEKKLIDVERLVSAAELLRVEIQRGGSIQGFKIEILARLATIDDWIVFWLMDKGRLDEALPLAIEERDLVRACRAADPDNILYKRLYSNAVYRAAEVEGNAGRWAAALDHLDAASVDLRNTPNMPELLWRAWHYSHLYLENRKALIDQGQADEARRALEGHLTLTAFLEKQEPPTPARDLYLASMLAERGERGRARELAAGVVGGQLLSAETNQSEFAWAVQAWYSLDMEIRIQELLKTRPDARIVEQAVDGYASQIAKTCHAFQIVPTARINLNTVLTQMTTDRRCGRIDEAERTVGVLLAFANRFADSVPDHAASYRLLSEAYVQQAKNAWKRENHHEIRRASTRAVEALQKALQFASNDKAIREQFILQQNRLDQLPADW